MAVSMRLPSRWIVKSQCQSFVEIAACSLLPTSLVSADRISANRIVGANTRADYSFCLAGRDACLLFLPRVPDAAHKCSYA
jgi:hypothetical protein